MTSGCVRIEVVNDDERAMRLGVLTILLVMQVGGVGDDDRRKVKDFHGEAFLDYVTLANHNHCITKISPHHCSQMSDPVEIMHLFRV